MELFDKLNLLAYLLSNPRNYSLNIIEDRSIAKVINILTEKKYPIFSKESYLNSLEENICHDYLYLFVGASKPLASPYASSYYGKDSGLMDKPAKNLIILMNKWGIELDEDNKDLPDHVVNIVSFLAVLLEHYQSVGEEVLKLELKADIGKIMDELFFLDEFYRRIKVNEKIVFYSIIVDILSDTITEVKKMLKE